MYARKLEQAPTPQTAPAPRQWQSSYQPPANWLRALTKPGSSALRDDLRTEHIHTVDALLMHIVDGDPVAAIMLRYLLSWLPHSIRKDGAIWKSAAHWAAETGLSKSKIYSPKRRQRLREIGIIDWIEKAQGVNQLHFNLDHRLFLRAIAKALHTNIFSLRIKLQASQLQGQSAPAQTGTSSPQPQSAPAKGRSAPAKIPLTVKQAVKPTEELTEERTDSASLSSSVNSTINLESWALLKETGLREEQAKQFACLPPSTITECISARDIAHQMNRITTTPLQYLIGALNNQLKKQIENPKPAPSQAKPSFAGMKWSDFTD